MTKCPTCGAREKRSNEQNKRYWALVHAVAEGVHPVDPETGEIHVYSDQSWHLHFRSKYLGCDDFTLPDGRTWTIPRSTTELDVAEFNDYMTAVEAWAAENNVFLAERIE